MRTVWLLTSVFIALTFIFADSASQAKYLDDCPYLNVSLVPVPGYWKRTDAEYQEPYRQIFVDAINKTGFKVMKYEDLDVATIWYLNTQVLNLRNGTFVWSWQFEKQPTVREGLLHFAMFQETERAGGDKFFSGVKGLLVTTPRDYGSRVDEATELLSGIFLSYAYELCANQGSTLDELRALRKELTLEIEREGVRTRATQSKTLKLEVEETP